MLLILLPTLIVLYRCSGYLRLRYSTCWYVMLFSPFGEPFKMRIFIISLLNTKL